MNQRIKKHLLKRNNLSSVLGLALDGNRLEVMALRRPNGSLEISKSFSISLSLDPLTNDPELVGREIRNHLEAAGVRERRCVLGLPVKWAYLLHVNLPELTEEDVPGFLQIEAERGFPCDPETLMVATACYHSPKGESQATLAGVPWNHLTAMENVLRCAQLKPVSFALGTTSLQPAETKDGSGILALVIGSNQVELQVTSGGGIAALRTLEGAMEMQGAQMVLQPEVITREVRITLGQLAPETRESVRRIRLFGAPQVVEDLAEELRERFQPAGVRVETVTSYAPGEFGLQLPPAVPVSQAFSLAANYLANRRSPFEFLPPKVSAWEKWMARYSSGTLQRAAIAAVVLLLGLGGAFAYQQWQLLHLGSHWETIKPRVRVLEGIQQRIHAYRPWFDNSLRSLSILRQLTMAFPEEGVVSAKSIEIREPNVVTCSGITRDNQELLKTMERLRTAAPVADIKVVQVRGKAPLQQFSFEFHWLEGKDK